MKEYLPYLIPCLFVIVIVGVVAHSKASDSSPDGYSPKDDRYSSSSAATSATKECQGELDDAERKLRETKDELGHLKYKLSDLKSCVENASDLDTARNCD